MRRSSSSCRFSTPFDSLHNTSCDDGIKSVYTARLNDGVSKCVCVCVMYGLIDDEKETSIYNQPITRSIRFLYMRNTNANKQHGTEIKNNDSSTIFPHLNPAPCIDNNNRVIAGFGTGNSNVVVCL